MTNSKNCCQDVEQSRKEEGEGQTRWCSQHEVLEKAGEILGDLTPWLVQVVDLFRPFRLFMSVFFPSYKKANTHIENGCLPWTTVLKLGFV